MDETFTSSFQESLFAHFDDPGTLCVFPSETVRRSWLASYTLASDKGVILPRRAMSWDRFTQLFHDKGQRISAGSSLRYLFAYDFMDKEGDTLQWLTQKEFPSMQKQYVPTVVTLLDRIPSLIHLKETHTDRYHQIPSLYLHDIALIRSSYEKFLKEHDIFDPHFSSPIFPHAEFKGYSSIIIISPELCSSFFEYRKALEEAPGLILLRPERRESGTLVKYENERQEIIAVFSEIRSLLDRGMHPDEIALSVSSLTRMLPAVTRFASEYDIPLRIQSGCYLSDYPAGRFFLQMEEVVSSDFSFESVKRFLLDPKIPWKKTDEHRVLIEKAIAYDIRQIVSPSKDDQWRILRDDYLHDLFSLIRAGVRAQEPKDILTAVNQFTEQFLDDSWGYDPSLSFQSDQSQALSAAVQLLVDLDTLSEQVPVSSGVSIYHLFTTLIQRQTFYPSGAHTGIPVYDTVSGLATNPSRHFFIGYTSQSVDMIKRSVPLLTSLVLDEVVSDAAFDNAFLSGGKVRFSYAVSGYSDTVSLPPERFLSAGFTIEAGIPVSSLESREEKVWRGKTQREEGVRVRQARGFRSAVDTVFAGKKVDIPRGSRFPLWDAAADDEGILHLSPTALDQADSCPAKFFASRILKVKKGEWSIQNLDHAAIGSLQHDILARFYASLEGKESLSCEEKRELLFAIIRETAEKERVGRVSSPLFVTRYIRSAYLESLLLIVDREASLFSTTRSIGLESSLKKRMTSFPVELNGRIDRIFSYETEEGNAIGILDYKKSEPPKVTQYKKPSYPLTSYQLPFYARLLEGSELIGTKGIGSGNYYSIKRGAFYQIWKDEEHLQELKKVCDEAIDVLVQRLKEGEMEAHVSKESCEHCEFRQICRRRYVLP